MKSLLITVLLISGLMTATVNATSCINSKVSGKGQPVLLMPGFVSDETIWQDVAERLSADYQVHQLSIAGFGKNPACKQADDIYNQVTKEVTSYINSKKLTKPIFIGHSMGGLMAFQLALSKKVILGGAISVDGLPFIGPLFTRSNETTVADLQNQALNIKAMYQRAKAADIKMMTKRNIAIQTKHKARYNDIVTMAVQSDPTTAGSAIYSVMTTDLRQQLNQLETPMLLIGASGGFNQEAQHKAIASLYKKQLKLAPNVSLIMNTKGRHFLMWDEPKWLTATIKQFIKERS